jgi:polysaccharide deacetylase 2 family uncharacterized protein YibQ
MAADDLNAPLGQRAKTRPRFRLPVTLQQATAGALGLCLAVFAGWALFADDPLGGEPVIVAATGPMNAPAAAAADAQSARRYDGPAASPPAEAAPPAAQTVTIIDGSTGKRHEVEIGANAGRAAVARSAVPPTGPRLVEASPQGPLPRIAADGTRPADAYARQLKANPARPNGPRIAIMVTGLGVSTAATQSALTKLPGAVTLAFTPYAADAESLVAQARGDGREVVLQIPMEPFDYPDNDPGPQTLLMALSPEQNIDRLHWLMGRFQGYVGVTNFMGARFTSSEQALTPMLRDIAKRGLIYIDDGSSTRSLAGQIAGGTAIPFAKADVALDALPTGANIDRALARLEATARERGVAIGITSALPAAIERIAQWSKSLESRGITLVPVSNVALNAKSS